MIGNAAAALQGNFGGFPRILSWTACPFSVGSCLFPQLTYSFSLSALRAAAAVALGSVGYFSFRFLPRGSYLKLCRCFDSLASRLGAKLPTMVLSEALRLQLFLVVRGGIQFHKVLRSVTWNTAR
jgi:hypothetical protein